MTTFFQQPSRYLFFTGKGGVGKTALACATAIRLADRGKRILLVSTDPASNLDEMLGVPLSHRPTPIPHVEGLSALNLDPEQAAANYRERVIAPYRDIWTEPQIGELREQLAAGDRPPVAVASELVLGSDWPIRSTSMLVLSGSMEQAAFARGLTRPRLEGLRRRSTWTLPALPARLHADRAQQGSR